VPDSPATGYGYIRKGEAVEGASGAYAVERFVEKPDAAIAQKLIDSGHLWNSGNFLFQAKAFLNELAALAPEIAVAVEAAVANAKTDLDFLRLDPEAFAKSPAISVDYAVMEKTKHAVVLPSRFPWSDIGSWSAVWDISEKDQNGNAALGDAVFEASSNSYVYSPELLTTLHGVDGLIVVATRDALLVTTKDQSQEIKSLVKHLTKLNRREATEHLKNYRPWGNYEQIDKGSRYQVKRITVKPNGILSLQSHFHRAEHWIVVSGTARVTIDNTITMLTENQSIYIPLGAVHRMENPGQIPLELIEVQSGSYLGEDDIVRYEDVYNRS
jgi:mannose-1-phosphate guanylyltransferase / mannose-6-phosphate isomerase